MKQFRKKPTIVEAVEWDGSKEAAADIRSLCKIEVDPPRGPAYVFTQCGLRQVAIGYWVVKGEDGAIDVCYPQQFALQYEAL